MPTAIVRFFRLTLTPFLMLFLALFATALLLQASPAGADERADFEAAFKLADAQYRIALKTLETSGREETSAEVARLRDAFQVVIAQFDANRTTLGADADFAGMLMQLDARIVGALLVIDFGSREAARGALAPIGQTLSELEARAARFK
jgi:hypothetical protein